MDRYNLTREQAEKCYQQPFAIYFGSTRIAIALFRWVVKFPALTEWRLFKLGIQANLREVGMAKKGSPSLCPVYAPIPIGLAILMPRTRPLTRTEWDSFNFDVWIRESGLSDNHVEHKLDSFGWLNERIVAVDYGN